MAIRANRGSRGSHGRLGPTRAAGANLSACALCPRPQVAAAGRQSFLPKAPGRGAAVFVRSSCVLHGLASTVPGLVRNMPPFLAVGGGRHTCARLCALRRRCMRAPALSPPQGKGRGSCFAPDRLSANKSMHKRWGTAFFFTAEGGVGSWGNRKTKLLPVLYKELLQIYKMAQIIMAAHRPMVHTARRVSAHIRVSLRACRVSVVCFYSWHALFIKTLFVIKDGFAPA